MVEKIWYENSGNNSELVTSLPIKTSSPYTLRVVYSIALPDLGAGDLIDARAHYEVTNIYTYNVMSGRGIILADSPTDTSGIELMEAATENVTRNMHHQCISVFGGMKVTEPMSGKYVNFIGFAGGSATYVSSGDYLKVEQDYGRAEVKVFPASMVE